MNNILKSIRMQVGNNEYIDLTLTGDTRKDFNNFYTLLKEHHRRYFKYKRYSFKDIGTSEIDIEFKGNKILKDSYKYGAFLLTIYDNNLMLLSIKPDKIDNFEFYCNEKIIKFKDIHTIARMTSNENIIIDYKVEYDNVTIEINDRTNDITDWDNDIHISVYDDTFISEEDDNNKEQ